MFQLLGSIGGFGTLITAITALVVKLRQSKSQEDTSWQGMLHSELRRALARIEELEKKDQRKDRRIEELERALRAEGIPIPRSSDPYFDPPHSSAL